MPGMAGAAGRGASMGHITLPLAIPQLQSELAFQPLPQPKWRTVKVESGQTLSQIFGVQGLGYGDLARVLTDQDNALALTDLHPGDELDFLLDDQGNFAGLRFDRGENQRVTLKVDGDGLRESVNERQLTRRVHVAHGRIDSSLFQAGNSAGMRDAMVLELAKVFRFDIDFALDLRRGDRFTVIYDDVWRDGEYLHEGQVLAAEFVNDDRIYTAVLFAKPDGTSAYYNEEGRPLTKSFLRTPVDFTRISSRFSVARKHPILGRMRAHEGVDYAAPSGTPIYAAGDGRIQFEGRARGYGNFIIIRHNDRISTAYGHMKRFAKGLHKGDHVRQGQVIGYVGMTGLATGPHLHYEFRVNGQQRDPLTVTLPKPEPLPKQLMAQFRSQATPMLARLEMIDGMRLARVSPDADH